MRSFFRILGPLEVEGGVRSLAREREDGRKLDLKAAAEVSLEEVEPAAGPG